MMTIASFERPEEAHLLRMRLEAVGIPAFVRDEHFVQMDMLYSNAIGGVRLQVANADLESARTLLAEDRGIENDDSELQCPQCGWTGVERERFSRRLALCSLLLCGLPLLWIRSRWRCGRCLHTWKPTAASNP